MPEYLLAPSPLDHDPAISGGGAQPGMELVPAWLKLLRLHKYTDVQMGLTSSN